MYQIWQMPLNFQWSLVPPLPYISLAYIPLLSCPFFDVAKSLENWEDILGLSSVAKHVALALILCSQEL